MSLVVGNQSLYLVTFPKRVHLVKNTLEANMTSCFRANGKVNLKTIPQWLSVETTFDANEPRFYSIWVVPWVAEVAIVLGTLEVDGTIECWITHLETLAFEDIVPVSCQTLFGPRADRDR